MATVAETSLSDAERRTLDRLVRALESRLGDDLLAQWLFGSKARGESKANHWRRQKITGPLAFASGRCPRRGLPRRRGRLGRGT